MLPHVLFFCDDGDNDKYVIDVEATNKMKITMKTFVFVSVYKKQLLLLAYKMPHLFVSYSSKKD